jgi:hypothetical protein
VIAAQPGTSSSAGAASLVRLFELLVELADRAVELPDDRDEVAGDPHLQLLIAPREPAADAFELRGAVEPAQRDLVGRVELVQMPTQPLLGAAALVDEIVAVIDQQLQLAVDLFVRPRPAQVRLSDRGSGDRECVDRVRLAACAARAALRHSQLRRHPHQLRAGTKQLPFEPASQLLGSPQPPRGARYRVLQPSRAARRCRLESPSPRAACLPRRRRLPSPIACVRPARSRSSASPPSRWGRPASGQTSIEAKRPRSYQVTLDGLGRRRRHNAGRSDQQVDIRNRVSRRRPSLFKQSDTATATTMN